MKSSKLNLLYVNYIYLLSLLTIYLKYNAFPGIKLVHVNVDHNKNHYLKCVSHHSESFLAKLKCLRAAVGLTVYLK